MRVLIIKTTSMGDVIHTLPALTDAGLAIPGIVFDWVVEKPFAEIPAWHPRVQKVIPVEMRVWRRNILKGFFSPSFKSFRQQIKKSSYDYIIDAQGLLKSAAIARQARGVRCGFDRSCVKEKIACLFYQTKIAVDPLAHAITRIRTLFAKTLQYAVPTGVIDYGIDRSAFTSTIIEKPYVIFLHGTTWVTKHYPETYWLNLCERVTAAGFQVKLPWGNAIEKARAERIACVSEHASVLPALNLAGLARVIAGARAVVAVDTGLGHLTAALDVPCVSLYGPTDPEKIGTRGASQIQLRAEVMCDKKCNAQYCARVQADVAPQCFAALTPAYVYAALEKFLQ